MHRAFHVLRLLALFVLLLSASRGHAEERAALDILVHDGLVSVQAPESEFSREERAILQKAIAFRVSDSPFRSQGTIRLHVRGALLDELKVRLHGVRRDDPKAVAAMLEELASDYVDERRSELDPVQDDQRTFIGQDFSVPANESLRRVIAIGSTGTIDGRVQDLLLVGANARLGPSARVVKSFIAVGSQLVAEPGAEISGQEVAVSLPDLGTLWEGTASAPHSEQTSWLARVVWSAVTLLLSLGLGSLFMRLFPHLHAAAMGELTQAPYASFGYGVLQVGLIVPAMFLLVLTVVGILLIPLFVLGCALTVWLAHVLGAVALGAWLRRNRERSGFAELLVGLLALHLSSFVPVLGGTLGLCTTALGLGALGRTLYRRIKARRTGGTEPMLSTRLPQGV